MFIRIVRRRVAAFITAGAATAAVLALAAPAGAVTGGPQISPQQAGYTATGAQFKAVVATAYMRNSAQYRGVVANYGHSVQLWSSGMVVTVGVTASKSGQSVYTPYATIYDRSTHQVIASNPNAQYCGFRTGCYPEGDPYRWGGSLVLSIRYSPATGDLAMYVDNPWNGSYGQYFEYRSSYTVPPQSFNQARVGTDFGSSPWDASYAYSRPATSLKAAVYRDVKLTSYSGHTATLVSWWVRHKLIAKPSGRAQVAVPHDLYNGGANFQTWFVPKSAQSSS